jgi:hypothetical protein
MVQLPSQYVLPEPSVAVVVWNEVLRFHESKKSW